MLSTVAKLVVSSALVYAATACVTEQTPEPSAAAAASTAPAAAPEAAPVALTDPAAVHAAATADALDDGTAAAPTQNATTAAANAAPEEAVSDAVALDDATAASDASATPVPTSAANGKEDGAWRALLTKDLVAIESKGDAFLEAASKLYDRLIAAGESATGAVDGGTRTAIDKEVFASRERYSDLMAAITTLHRDLDRTDVKAHLPLTAEFGEDTDVAELFNDFAAAASKAAGAYDPAGKAALTSLIFNGGTDEPMDGLPKVQQDALSLLDRLRVVRSDLTYVSSTVSSWAHDHVDIPNKLPKRLSGDGPSFPQDVDPSALTHH